MSVPALSVLLPVFNDEDFVAEALQSIADQTFEDYEIIAIDDGSADGSAEILDSFASRDSRIKVFRQENMGLGSTLNRAIELTKSDLLARHDADDRSHPERFRLQVEFLNSHPGTSMLGTGIRVIDTDGEFKYSSPTPTCNRKLRTLLKSSSPFAHGSVMMRRELVNKAGGYPSIIWLEDLVLWRAMAQLGEVENLDAQLYDYRVSPQNLYVPRKLQRRVVNLFNTTWPDDAFSTADLDELEQIRKQITPRVRKTQYHLNLAKGLLLNSRKRWEARKNLMLALATTPSLLEAWFQLAMSFLPRSIISAWRDRRAKQSART
jgi:glycosyltransferase involved in cell wall biosynthesis